MKPQKTETIFYIGEKTKSEILFIVRIQYYAKTVKYYNYCEFY